MQKFKKICLDAMLLLLYLFFQIVTLSHHTSAGFEPNKPLVLARALMMVGLLEVFADHRHHPWSVKTPIGRSLVNT